MAIDSSCTWIGLSLLFIGSIGNWLCICVFFRKRFRSSLLTSFFVALLMADCLYLTLRIIKLLYYQQTLFHNLFDASSCSSSILIRLYGYITQKAPQYLIPFCHYDFYIRFSLILMSFLALQRAYDIFHSSYRIIPRNSQKRSSSYILIVSAFILSYVFELLGLNLFCSYELSSKITSQWFNYIQTNLSNETTVLFSFIKNHTNNQDEIDCIMNNESSCTREQHIQLVRHYFDMHQRPIVHLIHKIQLSTIGYRMGRNELRLKYHYHTCPFRLQSDLFLKIYDLLYSRIIGFHRYTLILVFGSIIPSIVTIFCNALSLHCIIAIRSSVKEQSRASRRRTEETRRVVLIITTECLLAVINSWFVDIILSFKYCDRSVAIGDDCPHFLRRYQALLGLCDVLNSMSNIILYCYAGKRFRQELKRMLKAWIQTIKKRIPCYCRIQWRKTSQFLRTYDEETIQSESSSKPTKTIKYRNEHVKLRVVTYPTTVL